MGNYLITIVANMDGEEGKEGRRRSTEDASGCFLSHMHCSKIPRERLQCSLEKAEFALGMKGL